MEDNENSNPVFPDDGGTDIAADQPSAGAQEIQALKDERDGLFDRLLRKQAEFDNYKKRVERERSEFAQFASSELMKELLNVLDSFDLAIGNAAAAGSGKEEMFRGIELIHKQLQDTLGRFGLKAVEAKGKKFDPNFHQAVATQATNEVEENIVVEEMRKGYVLNGRLLRPAMVSVSVKG